MTAKYRAREQIGPATLYLADAIDVVPELEGIETVFTSPPYGNQRTYGSDRPFVWDDVVHR